MKPHRNNDLLRNIFRDRPRTNLLKHYEQKTITILLKILPQWFTPNILTGIGLAGNIIVAVSFILAALYQIEWLLLGLAGFVINWFGDSLDGRLAYFRNKPRKNYGFTLDFTIDWISIIIIGFGYIIYAEGPWELSGYGFVVMYGWEMILALIRYRLTGQYVIDSGKVGPTEVRIILCILLVAEVLFLGSLKYLATLLVVILFVVNIFDTHRLLQLADEYDRQEKSREKTGS